LQQQTDSVRPRLAMLLGLLAIVFLLSEANVPIGFCLAKRLFGIPCPGCGITASIMALISGRIDLAISANAAGPVVFAYALLHAGLLIAAAHRFLSQQTILRLIKRSDQCLLVVLLANWLMRI
jgi:hypothetical protein